MVRKALRPGQSGAAALLATAVALGACAHAEPSAPTNPPAPSVPSTTPADPSAFGDWLKTFKDEAVAAGVSRDVVNREFASVAMVQRVFELNDNQPEFSRAIWDYVDGAVSATRVETGKTKYAMNSALLAEIEKRYGVDPHIIAAIWGLESSYGAIMGDYDALSALATLGWTGRRTAYGRAQAVGALKINESGYATRA
ncbi:MAG: lytic murein transglycosylase, partial [Parvularculaceae bacterium]|nr:lytic murein transglycosylase [Parvularculaceae bacterium]